MAAGHTGFQLSSQSVVVQFPPDQDQLVLALTSPVAVIDREALAGKVEDVTALAFLEPQNALRAEHALGKLVVQKILKSPEVKGISAGKGQ